MKQDLKFARMVGTFYLTATIAGIIGLGLTDSIVNGSDYLVEVAANENQILVGSLFELLMGVAVVGIGISIYPILNRQHASIAVGYVAARIVEGVIFLIDVIILLTILTLSQEFAQAAEPDAAYFHTMGALLKEARDWLGHVSLDVAVFPLGAMLLNVVLYQSKLITRWLSGWGIVGAILYWAASLLVMFDVIEPLKTVHIALQAPIGLQEIAFALWLIFKGFSPTETAQTT